MFHSVILCYIAVVSNGCLISKISNLVYPPQAPVQIPLFYIPSG